MHMLNRLRPIFLALTIVAAALLALGVLTLPGAKDASYEGFSAVRAAEDIEAISKVPHSVQHPEDRAAVREYLVDRLEQMGGKVTTFRYDSLTGPKNRSVQYTFDAVDVFAEFPPLKTSEDTTWLMLVAHYDSRYENHLPEGPVLSYGAADDGYGVAVILETVSQLLKKRDEWKQGVKVLFTDAEEAGMMGMESIWNNDRYVFDNTGLMINVEARGTYGPALLFETSPGNEKLLDLYAYADYPFTYSLTTIVYGFLPNFSDFTIVKDELPGMNFSTVADINHYHTDLDCFENISLKTIQHYGDQIFPVAEKYLTDEVYSDKDYLKAEKDTVFFTIPLLGLFNVSKTMYMVINLTIFLVFILLLAVEGLRGRIKAMKVFRNSCIVLLTSVGVLALGELVAYLASMAAGAYFRPFGVLQGIKGDNWISLLTILFVIIAAVAVYVSFRQGAIRQTAGSMRASAAFNAANRYAYGILYGTLCLLFLLNVVLVAVLGENVMFIAVFAFAVLAMVLWHMTSFKFWLLADIFLMIVQAMSFSYALFMALTIGALGVIAMLAFIYAMVLIPLSDMYISYQPAKKNK